MVNTTASNYPMKPVEFEKEDLISLSMDMMREGWERDVPGKFWVYKKTVTEDKKEVTYTCCGFD